jgi:diguanylate cyclase (GGDEF)-like protein
MTDRLRELVAGLKVSQGGRVAQVTVSFGLTTIDQQNVPVTKEELIRLADEALYEAKRSGRNRCCVRLLNPQRVASSQAPDDPTTCRL